MTDTGMQIDWSTTRTADAVAAARQAMQSKGGLSPFTKALRPAPAAAAPVAPSVTVIQPAPANKARLRKLRSIGGAAGVPSLYALATLFTIAIGMAAVWKANVAFAPEMYNENGMVPAAEAHAKGLNYAVFDLNLNVRRWREEQVARFTETPDVVLLGASHWQEAHAGLVKSERMYNGHIHRDYWEDLLGVVEVYVRNKRLPKRIILAIRDKQFTPVEKRTDFLWEPGIPNYRRMADRLGIEKEDAWKTYPYQRIKERLSLNMLFNNVTRWYNAEERPHASTESNFKKLDTLLPDGSILWSDEHKALFTPERTKHEAMAFADNARFSPPVIDPKGVEAFDALLAFLKARGTQVVLVNPPFNPMFYDAVQNGTYPAGLDKIRELMHRMASKHGLHVIGEFDPAKVGCTSDQYIDAEHSNPACLAKIFAQYEALIPQLDAELKKGAN